MPLRPIFYDTETTGVRSDKDRIIELAAFDSTQNKSFCKLINPGSPIPPEASSIHHITDDMVANAPTFSEVIDDFASFCSGDFLLIAHNNDAFDLPFLKEEFKRCEKPFPNWKFLDSLKWAKKYRNDLPRHSLQFLREIYHLPPNQAHRALNDVHVLHQVFSCLTDDLSMEEILSLMEETPEKIRMPFGKYKGRSLLDIPKDYVIWLSKSGAFDKRENRSLKENFEKLGVI